MTATPTTAGLLIGAGVGLTGTVFGAQADALLLGLASAIIVSVWLPSIDDRLKAAAAVAFATLLAGYGAPVASGWLAANITGIEATNTLRLLAAVVIGGAAPPVIPITVVRLQAIVRGGSLP